jgi:excisionase family DNA binding protein
MAPGPTDNTTTAPTPRNLGTIREAADRIGVTPGTIRNHVLKHRVYAERVGRGRYLVDLDDVEALRVEFYPVDPNQVADAPPLTGPQIFALRQLLRAGTDHGAA